MSGESRAYGHFRSQIVAQILEKRLTPAQVADRLSARLADFPEIQTEEIAKLRSLGNRWDGSAYLGPRLVPKTAPAPEQEDLWEETRA